MSGRNKSGIGAGSWLALASSGLVVIGATGLSIASSRPVDPIHLDKVAVWLITFGESGACHADGVYSIQDVNDGLSLCPNAEVVVQLPNDRSVRVANVKPSLGMTVSVDSTVLGASYTVSYGVDAKDFVHIQYDGLKYGPSGK